MRKLLAAVVLCVPVVSNADLLFIKYEGAVSGIEEQTGAFPHPYSIGDPVSGQMTINLALADGGGSNPAGTGSDYLPGLVSFINGRPDAAEGKTNDAVFLYNNVPLPAPASGTADRVEVHDSVIVSGFGGNGYDGLSIIVQRFSPYGQLITDVGSPVQQFDVTPDEGTTLTGKIYHGFTRFVGAAGSFKQTIDVAFSHVSMGVCKPST